MSESWNKQICANFQSKLPGLVGQGESLAGDPHLQSCALCHDLLDELEIIAAAARRLFPIEEPRDAVWEHIQSAIENEETESYSE